MSITGQFELHCRRLQIKQLSREQLESEIWRLMEWDALKKAQLNSALKVITEMQAKVAALTEPDADPLQPWLDMVASMKKPPPTGEGCKAQG